MTELEEKIGYMFRDAALLERALTTPSVRQSAPDTPDNQRLEFLGDAVLGLLTADALCAAFPDEQEGPLTTRRASLVSGATLASVAERIGLRKYLKRAVGLPEFPPHAKVLADAMEALIGAAWLDGGIDAARAVFAAFDLPIRGRLNEWGENPKGHLQNMAQAMRPSRKPVYTVDLVKGPPHAPTVTVTVSVEGLGRATATATGSQHSAEVAAATALLESIKGKTNLGRC